MRYLNWDVLLFPDESKVPIQEFDVKCHGLVIAPENLPSAKLIHPPGKDQSVSLTHIPTLTCFIASLEYGQLFRISIHSWEKPQPSGLLNNFKAVPGRVAFEATLFIDGHMKVQCLLGEHSAWPEVISTVGSSTIGYCKELRFPDFHSEILQQSHWDARDGLGRIRIFIAEGILRSSGSTDARGFYKFRDLVAFSFQHAPRHVLELSGIAWPNARMFNKPNQQGFKLDHDAHAHSPQRSAKDYESKATSSAISKPSDSSWYTKHPLADDDPFIDPRRSLTLRQLRKTNTDVTMSDYHANKNRSEMSDVATQQLDFHQQIGRAAIDEIVRALTPTKRTALLNALTPSSNTNHVLHGCNVNHIKSVPYDRMQPIKSFEPPLRSRLASNRARRCSVDSQRSLSGQSTVMSWDETPVPGGLRSVSIAEYPGLLPSIQSSSEGRRPGSMESKRKRILSPQGLDQDAVTLMNRNLSDKFTSPSKNISAAEQVDRIATSINDKNSSSARVTDNVVEIIE